MGSRAETCCLVEEGKVILGSKGGNKELREGRGEKGGRKRRARL